jgi:hypothetical protein
MVETLRTQDVTHAPEQPSAEAFALARKFLHDAAVKEAHRVSDRGEAEALFAMSLQVSSPMFFLEVGERGSSGLS